MKVAGQYKIHHILWDVVKGANLRYVLRCYGYTAGDDTIDPSANIPYHKVLAKLAQTTAWGYKNNISPQHIARVQRQSEMLVQTGAKDKNDFIKIGEIKFTVRLQVQATNSYQAESNSNQSVRNKNRQMPYFTAPNEVTS